MLAWNHAKELIVYYLRHITTRLIFLKMIKNADAALLPLLFLTCGFDTLSTGLKIALSEFHARVNPVPVRPSLADRTLPPWDKGRLFGFFAGYPAIK